MLATNDMVNSWLSPGSVPGFGSSCSSAWPPDFVFCWISPRWFQSQLANPGSDDSDVCPLGTPGHVQNKGTGEKQHLSAHKACVFQACCM